MIYDFIAKKDIESIMDIKAKYNGLPHLQFFTLTTYSAN